MRKFTFWYFLEDWCLNNIFGPSVNSDQMGDFTHVGD